MFKRLTRKTNNTSEKTKLLWDKEFKLVENGLDEEQVVSFVEELLTDSDSAQKVTADSIRSLIDRAVTDAEQIAASIKTRAIAEAQEEAINIIDQAKQGAKDIKSGAEARNEKETEAALKQVKKEAKRAGGETKVTPTAKITEPETPDVQEAASQSQELSGVEPTDDKPVDDADTAVDSSTSKKLTSNEKDKEILDALSGIQLDDSVDKEEPSDSNEKESVFSETVQEVSSKTASAITENSAVEAPIPVMSDTDIGALFSGEIELIVQLPTEPAAVSKLYNHLQSTSDMKILYTRGSWDKGSIITVSLEKPLPLLKIISNISGINVIPQLTQQNEEFKGASGILLGANKSITRIALTLKNK